MDRNESLARNIESLSMNPWAMEESVQILDVMETEWFSQGVSQGGDFRCVWKEEQKGSEGWEHEVNLWA